MIHIFTLQGKYTNATIHTDVIEPTAISQIYTMLNQPITEHTNVAIMPDVHAGKGSTIGTTIRLPKDPQQWKVSPNIVGVDIGCGMLSYKLAETTLDFKAIDAIINQHGPAGFNKHKTPKNTQFTKTLLNQLHLPLTTETEDTIQLSLGTLGGGNHFIEIAKDETNHYWLTVHSGSRNLGLQVAKYYQKQAELQIKQLDLSKLIQQLKNEHRENEIQQHIHDLKQRQPVINKALAYLSGDPLQQYLHDMALAQQYAAQNRKTMLDTIIKQAGLTAIDQFDSVHNYIDIPNGIIRKGATDASNGTRLIIPINMRDGSLICTGKGNSKWNNSAPHGAGRQLSRSKAKELLHLTDYQDQMKNIYTSSVQESTLDEAPDAYKPLEAIINNIDSTVTVNHHIKTQYNFKAH